MQTPGQSSGATGIDGELRLQTLTEQLLSARFVIAEKLTHHSHNCPTGAPICREGLVRRASGRLTSAISPLQVAKVIIPPDFARHASPKVTESLRALRDPSRIRVPDTLSPGQVAAPGKTGYNPQVERG